ncbi:MAG: hypothetical protein ACLR7O_07600 [Ruminococcus callidus]|jgi:hypothetical protein
MHFGIGVPFISAGFDLPYCGLFRFLWNIPHYLLYRILGKVAIAFFTKYLKKQWRDSSYVIERSCTRVNSDSHSPEMPLQNLENQKAV